MTVGQSSRGGKGIDQIFGNHYETKPQSRENRQTESSDIDNTISRLFVESLKRGERSARITEFAVVIILDDPSAGALRPFKERQSSRQTHNRSERHLMRRSDKCEAGKVIFLERERQIKT